MRIFRRKRGRHALGAAVTSIPSGPLAAPVRELRPEISEEGRPEATWQAGVRDALPAAPPVCLPDPLPAAPPVDLPDALPAAPPVDLPDLLTVAPAEAPVAAVRADAAASARTALESSLEQLLGRSAALPPEPAPAPTSPPVPAPAPATVPVPVQAPPPAARVQLGFRDGTSTALDPASAQSRALEQLATSLARRD